MCLPSGWTRWAEPIACEASGACPSSAPERASSTHHVSGPASDGTVAQTRAPSGDTWQEPAEVSLKPQALCGTPQSVSPVEVMHRTEVRSER